MSKKPFRNVLGEVFGDLVCVQGPFREHGVTFWLCECGCGNSKKVRLGDLTSGSTKSCGCKEGLRTHGKSKTPEYSSWVNMRKRCNDKDHPRYADWGGRGIVVCREWEESFERFFTDMGPKPTSKHSIDRVDNNRGYYPENCRWATPKEQAANRRVDVHHLGASSNPKDRECILPNYHKESQES